MTELITAAAAAAERGVSPSRMRGLISVHGVVPVSREPGRSGGNLYDADDLRAIPRFGRGRRNDVVARRIEEAFAAAVVVADAGGHRAEYEEILAACRSGVPGSVDRLLAALRRWTDAARADMDTPDASAVVEWFAARIGDSPDTAARRLRSGAGDEA